MVAALALAVSLAAAAPPAPTDWVTDAAGVLGPARAQLDAELAEFSRRTGHQVLVYVGRSTGGEPIEDFAVRAFEAWKPGKKGLDDGAVLFVMVDDRAARIEVGYGLEPVLTDLEAARILRDQLVPRMRAGDPAGAVQGAARAMLQVLGGGGAQAPPATELPPGVERAKWVAMAVLGGLFVVLAIFKPRWALFLVFLLARGGHRGGKPGGGGFRGGGGRSGGGGATSRW